MVSVCRHLIANGANLSLVNNTRSRPIDLATPSVTEVLQEGDEGGALRGGDLDEDSQLLEASKNGDLATIKVRA